MATVPPVLVVSVVNGLVAPTAPLKVVAPDVFTNKLCKPLIVLPKVMSPAPELVKMVSAPSMMAPE